MFTTKGNKTTQKYNADDGYKATKSKNNDQKKIQITTNSITHV